MAVLIRNLQISVCLGCGAEAKSSINTSSPGRTSVSRAWKFAEILAHATAVFGTGGRRGMMYPVGTNVLNDRTIAESARGLADYVISRKEEHAPKSCVIARDSRHNSENFAELCPRVLAAAVLAVASLELLLSASAIMAGHRSIRMLIGRHSAGKRRMQRHGRRRRARSRWLGSLVPRRSA